MTAKKKTHTINLAQKRSEGYKQLSEVIDVLLDHKLTYWIEYGTLLGAIREKEVIPWDTEYDIGVWYNEYKLVAKKLQSIFKNMGYIIDYSAKDRVKLIHKENLIGGFNVDLHLYHINDNIAYVSSNQREKKRNKAIQHLFLSKLYSSLKVIEDVQPRKVRLGRIIKQLMRYEIETPLEFKISLGRFNFEESFVLETDNTSYNFDLLFLKSKHPLEQLQIRLLMLLPQSLIVKLKKRLEKSYGPGSVTDNIQAFPKDFFENLTKTKFGPLNVCCPADYEQYLLLVYGNDWHIRKSNYNRSNIGVNKSKKSIFHK